MLKKLLASLICALALLTFLNAGPAFAAQAPALNAPAPAGCAGTLNLDAVSGKGQICQAAAPKAKTPEPEFMVGGTKFKYCVCSCGYPCTSDALIADLNSADFAGVVVPGGFMPDKLRRNPNVLSLVREFAAS